jgi:uncharacterized membrane protein
MQMSKFVVIVFPDEAQAYQGTRALKELHAEGSLTLYGLAVVVKDASGKLAIQDAVDEGPLGTAVGALTGGLVGVIAGPVGMLAGTLGGTLIGSLFDIANYGVSADFVAKVSSELTSGRSAVVAEIVETWTTPLDMRMESLGGIVLRTWRADFEDEQIAQEIAAENAEWEQLRADYARATAETKAKIKTKLDDAKAKLEATKKKADARLETLDKELKARVAAMEQQAATAKADAKQKINQRISALRSDYQTRSAKLKQAWAMAKEALAA